MYMNEWKQINIPVHRSRLCYPKRFEYLLRFEKKKLLVWEKVKGKQYARSY